MIDRSSSDDDRYLEEFRAYRIDAGQFHHREHLRVAYTLLANNSLEDAFSQLKGAILGLLNHLGAGTAKYHETMTYAWLLVVHHLMHTGARCASFEDFIRAHPMLLDQRLVNAHYSESLMKSRQAKTRVLEPDLQEIPRHRSK